MTKTAIAPATAASQTMPYEVGEDLGPADGSKDHTARNAGRGGQQGRPDHDPLWRKDQATDSLALLVERPTEDSPSCSSSPTGP